MTQTVTLEDGSIHSFPDDATPDEMNAVLPPSQPNQQGSQPAASGQSLAPNPSGPSGNEEDHPSYLQNVRDIGNQSAASTKEGYNEFSTTPDVVGKALGAAEMVGGAGRYATAPIESGFKTYLEDPLDTALGYKTHSGGLSEQLTGLAGPAIISGGATEGANLIGQAVRTAPEVPGLVGQAVKNVGQAIKNAPEGGGLTEAAADEGFRPIPAIDQAKSRARDILSQALNTEGLDPKEIAARLEDAKKTGLPLTTLDVATQNVGGVQTQGRNLLGLADAAANMPGEGSVMAGDVASRGFTAKKRIGDAFDQFISSGKPYDVSDDALQKMSTEAAPAYEKAFAQSPIYNDRIAQFLQNPEIQTGIKRGMNIQRIEAMAAGQPFEPNDYGITGWNEAGDPIISGTPNTRLLDAGKKGLDAMIADETNDLTGKATEMGRALTKLKSSYLNTLDQINPDYAAARNAYGSQASRLQALRDGMNFQQMSPEEIKRYMANPNNTLADQMAFAVGTRQKLQDIMGQVGDNANAVTRLWKDNIRDRLEPMFGDKDAFAQFSDIMNHEQNMARVNGVLTRGSQTMPRQQYADAIQGNGPTNIVGRALHAVTSPSSAALSEGSNFLSGALKKQATGMSNATGAEIMRYLTSSDPELWRQFSLYKSSGGAVYARGGTIKKLRTGRIYAKPKSYSILENRASR